MSSKEYLNGMAHRLSAIALISLVAGAGVVGAFYQFVGINAIDGFSTDPSDWANFGDYLGGVLGSIFSFFAFLGLLLTLNLQARANTQVAQQSQVEELQRLMSSLSIGIDARLEKVVVVSSGSLTSTKHVSTILSLVIKGSGHSVISGPYENNIRESARHRQIAVASDVDFELSEMNVEFDQLAWLLQEFRTLGGSDVVHAFYVRRYSQPVCYLYHLGHVSGVRIEPVFNPEEYKHYLA